ncbi:hypothetical protein V8D89_012776 [Ganoderma adspersum]
MMGCAGASSMPPALAQRFTIASRTCLMAADCILIFLTWSQLPTEHKSRVFRRRTSLIDVLLRDVLLVLNVLHLVFTLLSVRIYSLMTMARLTTDTGIWLTSRQTSSRFRIPASSPSSPSRNPILIPYEIEPHLTLAFLRLTTNLVSRFLLDLQAADRAVRDQVSSISENTLSHTSTVVFRQRPADSVACSIPLEDYHSEHEDHLGSNLSSSWETR